MVGNALLVAPVVVPGAREREVYLPGHEDGRTEWVDFHTGQYYRAGLRVKVEAPLGRLPLFVRAGAVLPMTDSDDFANLHDEPSRSLRVFPQRNGPRESVVFASELYEDDGLSRKHLADDWALLSFRLSQDASGLRLAVERSGRFQLPYQGGRVMLPPGETRQLTIDADAGLRWTIGDQD